VERFARHALRDEVGRTRVVVAAEPITSIDVTSADALTELDNSLKADGIELCFAELKDPVKDKLKRFGLLAEFGEARFFPTKESAVSDYLKTVSLPENPDGRDSAADTWHNTPDS